MNNAFHPRLIVIGASAGGLDPLRQLARDLPAGLPAAVLVTMHIGNHPTVLSHLVQSVSRWPVAAAVDGEPVTAGRIYVAPPDRHLLVHGHAVKLSGAPKQHHTRPAIDPLFLSAALARGPGVIAVVLSGLLNDGTAGLQAVRHCGGIGVVQDPQDALEPSMPHSARRLGGAEHCVPAAALGALLGHLVQQQERPMADVPESIAQEAALMLGDGEPLQHLLRLGTPSTFACPDCHGALWRINGSQPLRFRCHTGHGFTAQTLEHALSLSSDEALWSALRAVQERRMLLLEMASRTDPPANGVSEAAAGKPELEAAAAELGRTAMNLRDLLERGQQVPATLPGV